VGNHLDGKVVVVTGGGNGIGRAIALAAAAEGASVVVADYGVPVSGLGEGSSEAAEKVVAEIEAAGGKAVASATDISTMAGGKTVVQAAVDNFGRLDGMLCSAGVTVTKYLYEITEEEWDSVLDTHIKGHFSCAKAAAEVMMEQKFGRMLFFSSGALTGMPNMTAYATAKAGILGFTWSTAYALAKFGITTNCLIPSAATRMSDSIYTNAGTITNRFGDTMKSELAEGTYRDPSNIAPLAIFLLSDAAQQINGQVFRVQGYEIAKMNMMSFTTPPMTSIGAWDVDTLAERLPQELGPNLTPLPVPWPERKEDKA
jgi:NAD(P)-dependent dehydrogenase (short-subunit alcohol dehydrogenase family)